LSLSKFWQFWAESAILAMVENMPKARLKSQKPSNSLTMNPNTAWNGSLESYHPYLTPQKVSKIPQTHCIHNTLPKNATTIFAILGLNMYFWDIL
jgi:hypothetical protein